MSALHVALMAVAVGVPGTVGVVGLLATWTVTTRDQEPIPLASVALWPVVSVIALAAAGSALILGLGA